MSTPTPNTKSTSKSSGAKKSLTVTLRLPAKLLADYPSDSTPKPSLPPPTIKAPPSVPDTTSAADKTSESNSTPNPDGNALAPPPKVDGRRKRGGAAAGGVSGRKRAPPSIDPNGPIRERGRPGPKKKPRLPDGTIDHSASAANKAHPTSAAAAARLGPKANTGNINANLRALDRTGKPCRKWEKKPLQIKSFTGVGWGLSSWKAPAKVAVNGDDGSFPGDVKSDESNGSSGKGKGMMGSSAVPSEGSRGEKENGVGTPMEGVVSSPAPVSAEA